MRTILPEVDSGSGIVLLAMGILYGGGFLIGAWVFVRRLSRKQRPDQDQEPSNGADTNGVDDE